MRGRDASTVAGLLVEYGRRLALRGGNPYRARAYARAADSLLELSVPLEELVGQDRLREIPGVGAALAAVIAELHRRGTHPTLEAMRREVPAAVLDMLGIPGLRPEQVLKLYRQLGVSSVDELEQAVRADRLKHTKGFGGALQRKIAQGLDIKRGAQGLRHMHRAAEWLRVAEASLKRSRAGLTRIVAAGDFRRGCELIGTLALVAQTPTPAARPQTLTPSDQLSVHLTGRNHYGATLLHATGSAAHLDGLRALAAAQGLVLDPLGLRRGRKRVAGASEEEIYAALGLAFIAPELREGKNEIDVARDGKLPVLVQAADIRGILHAHTDGSDGVDTLETMAAATRARGYGYFGVADHSQSAGYAGGLTLAEIAEQHAAADRLNAGYGTSFRIFKGIEFGYSPRWDARLPG